jgi:hypothetical protein
VATKKLEVIIAGNATDAKKAFQDLSSSAEKSGKKTEAALSGTTKGMTSVKNLAAGLAVTAFFTTAISEGQESQKTMAQVKAVIKSTGGVANVTAGHVNNLSTSLSNQAGIDDELIARGEAMLLTFKNVRNEAGKGNDIFDRGTRAALDMSVAYGQDLQSSVILVGKALNDPIKGLSALTRVGVTFTEQQKEQIKTLVASGDTLGAQKIILKEFESEFGGQAAAQATALDKLKTTVLNFAEAVGGAVMPVVNLLSTAGGALGNWFDNLSSGVQKTIVFAATGALAWLKFGDSIGKIVGNVASAGKAIFTFAANAYASGGAIGLLSTAMTGLTVAAGVAFIAMLAFNHSGGGVAKTVKTIADEVNKTGRSLDQVFSDRLLESLHNTDFGRGLADGMHKAGLSVQDLLSAVKAGDPGMKAFAGRLRAVGVDVDFGKKGLQANQVGLQALLAEYQGSQDAIFTFKKAQHETALSTQEASDAVDDLSNSIKSYTDLIFGIQASQDKVDADIQDLADSVAEAAKSGVNLNAALDGTAPTMGKAGEAARDLREKYRTLIEDEGELLVANYRTATANGKSAEATSQLAGAAVGASAKLHDQIIAQGGTAATANTAAGQIWQMISAADSVPAGKSTKVQVTGAATAMAWLAGVAAAAAAIPKVKTITVKADINSALAGINAAHYAAGHAKGGLLDEGWNIINEQGPELLHKRGSTVQVLTADQTRGVMSGASRFPGPTAAVGSGSTTIININAAVMTVDNATEEIRQALLRKQRRSAQPILPGVA